MKKFVLFLIAFLFGGFFFAGGGYFGITPPPRPIKTQEKLRKNEGVAMPILGIEPETYSITVSGIVHYAILAIIRIFVFTCINIAVPPTNLHFYDFGVMSTP